MKARKLRLPSPAMVIAIVALIAATTGSAFAASSLITSSKIKNGTIKLVDISASTQKSLKKGTAGPKGDKGDKGDAGATGAAGAPGSALGYAHINADGSFDAAHSSSNITSAMVSASGVSAACFASLPFTVHNAVATVEYDGGAGTQAEMVQVALAGTASGYVADCPGGTSVEVAGYQSNAYHRVPFYIVFN